MPATEDDYRLAIVADLCHLIYQCTVIAETASVAVKTGCVGAELRAIQEPLEAAVELIGEAVAVAKGGREIVVDRRDSPDALSTPVRIRWADG